MWSTPPSAINRTTYPQYLLLIKDYNKSLIQILYCQPWNIICLQDTIQSVGYCMLMTRLYQSEPREKQQETRRRIWGLKRARMCPYIEVHILYDWSPLGILLLLSGWAEGDTKASSIFELERIWRLLIVNRTFRGIGKPYIPQEHSCAWLRELSVPPQGSP